MKKANGAAVVSTMIVCYIFWLLVTGQIVEFFYGEASWQILAAGLIVSFAVALFSARFFIHDDTFFLANPIHILKLIGYCFGTFMIELAKANIDMAKRAFSPKLPANSGIVKVPVNLDKEYAQAMLANSITLTPGTITMDMAEDGNGQLYYYIHWIDVASQDPEEAGEMIKGALEKGIGGIWK